MTIETRTTKMTRTVNKRRQMSERLQRRNYCKWMDSKFGTPMVFDLVFTPDTILRSTDEKRGIEGWNKFQTFMNEGKSILMKEEEGVALFWVDGYKAFDGGECALPILYESIKTSDNRISVRIRPHDTRIVDWATPELLERVGVSTRVYCNGKLYKRVSFIEN